MTLQKRGVTGVRSRCGLYPTAPTTPRATRCQWPFSLLGKANVCQPDFISRTCRGTPGAPGLHEIGPSEKKSRQSRPTLALMREAITKSAGRKWSCAIRRGYRVGVTDTDRLPRHSRDSGRPCSSVSALRPGHAPSPRSRADDRPWLRPSSRPSRPATSRRQRDSHDRNKISIIIKLRNT
jgi:hypothetical protein